MRWALGLGRDDGAFDDLVRRYGEPHRRYHTLAHVEACLRLFDEVRALARRPGEIECALWYHDAIYEPAATGNEARSAALARADLARAGADDAVAARIEHMIRATESHTTESDEDARLLLDIDLSVLASGAAGFASYERRVREEHAFVPDEAWRVGRRLFLERLLARTTLFATPLLRARFEALARANLDRAIRALAP